MDGGQELCDECSCFNLFHNHRTKAGQNGKCLIQCGMFANEKVQTFLRLDFS